MFSGRKEEVGMCPTARTTAASAIHGFCNQAAVPRKAATGARAIGTGMPRTASNSADRGRPRRR